MKEHELVTKHQSGNRKFHSTETLNIAVTDILLEAIDKQQLSIIVFLDLSKAFDSVQHDILLNKLMELGVSTEVLNWFKSYLSNRSQYVRIGAVTSTSIRTWNPSRLSAFAISFQYLHRQPAINHKIM